MTYCCGIHVEDGIVFASDTRTNAGPDHIAVVPKMSVWERPGDRVIVLLVSGNLAITQKVINLLNERLQSTVQPNLWTATSLFHVAQLIGDTVREVHRLDSEALRSFGYDFAVSLILGGQIAGEAPRLFNIYAAGNFVEATRETPYFQIGEVKYGKPMLDRVVTAETPLGKAAKCALISFASTLRSNVTVGMPIDLLIYRRDLLKVDFRRRYQQNDAYFEGLSSVFNEGIIRVFDGLPDPG
jgi:putative proteasome-type protease